MSSGIAGRGVSWEAPTWQHPKACDYGHRVGKSLALGHVRTPLAVSETALEVELVGTRVAARVIDESPYDPGNTRLRGTTPGEASP